MAANIIETSIDEVLTGSYLPGDTITFDANFIQAQLKAYHRTANLVKSLRAELNDTKEKLESAKLQNELNALTKHRHYVVPTLDVKAIFEETC